MTRVHVPMPSQTKAAQRVVQRQCASCRQAQPRGPCPECAKQKRKQSTASPQARLQVSTPGDAGEREAERAADAVMEGRVAQLTKQPGTALLQRQDDGTTAAPPPEVAPEPAPAPLDAPGSETVPATAGASGTSTSTCTPTAFSRADYLTQPHTSTGDFGMTRLDGSLVTMPSVTTTATGRGRVRIAPTTAALGTIPSVFTGAGTFTEGTAHFIDQDGTTGCPSGRIPLRWTITPDGADKIREGEQEHCADFQLAFDLSLRRFADGVNVLAASGTTFASQATAERAVTRRTSVAPADWRGVFNCLARRTLLRDRRNEHTPRPMQRPPRLQDSCAFARMIVTARSLPHVGQTASSSIVQGCGEHGASTGGAGGGSGGTSAPVAKPESIGHSPHPVGGTCREDAALVQRSQDGMEADGIAMPHHDAHVERVLATSGRPLDSGVRGFMESRFSRDFSQVRIHDDAEAAGSAQALHANAYTVGRDIVFNQGRYAPDSQAGMHLLAHELAHVVQQHGGGALIQREMYYGGGYRQIKYGSTKAELKAASAGKWHPATPDMAATAAGSGGGQPVSSIGELLAALESKAAKSVTRLNLIGHSNRSAFSFGGAITPDNVEFDASATLYADSLKDHAARIAKLRDRFADGAKIVLYSCNAGVGTALLDALSKAFGVCVEGFTTEVWWCISPNGKDSLLRGRTWAENPHDPLPASRPDCAAFASDVTTLTPGTKSCEGVAGSKDKKP